jgi:hypothetical protein
MVGQHNPDGLTPLEAFSDAVDDAEMERGRFANSRSGSIPVRSRLGSRAFPRMPSGRLDSKKNLLPPLREKFVLDIPFVEHPLS